VIPADLGAELTAAVRHAVAAGELPPAAGQVVPSGTWRPAGARRYATSLPFELSRIAGRDPRAVAAALGQALAGVPWVSSAEVTGAGYLTIDVTPAALAAVATRISRAGLSCACGGAVGDPALTELSEIGLSETGAAGTGLALPDLAAAAGWRQAGQAQAAALIARLRQAAVTPLPDDGRPPDGNEQNTDTKRGLPGARHAGPAAGSLASAVSYAGADAVRYWVTRNPSWPDRGPAVASLATRDLANPWYAVTFAQADAARTGRWAADLGVARAEPAPSGERLADLLRAPAEVALLGRLSWLGERVAGAARRARPADLTHYLEGLAAAWLDCRENCPALPFGGAAAPRSAAGISARLLLAGAAATALESGLRLAGVRPPGTGQAGRDTIVTGSAGL
jgi:arginyl-tRNA synthetase